VSPPASGDEGDDERPLITYVVGRLDRVIRSRLGEALAPHDLTVAQFTTLSILARRPGLSNAQLARRALILPQSMIQVISALESRGLIVRTPAGGRTLKTQLTTTGRALLARTEQATHALETEMLSGDAGPQDAERAVRTMQRWSETLASPRAGNRS
jgi:DNA-binding MarR family transcriptional regulator